MKKPLLVFTNGRESTWALTQYAAWLAERLDLPLTLVGILENSGEEELLEEFFSRAVSLFQEKGLKYSLRLETGAAEEVIPALAARLPAEMALVAPLGRPILRRFLVGRSFRHILADVQIPILYVPAARIPAQKILICLGGLEYGLAVEQVGVDLAQKLGAEVTLLTVVPAIDLDYPEARLIREQWETLAETQTLPGKTLRAALEVAQKAGVKAQVKTRLGNVLEEIRAELREGGYDMICMGSAHSSESLRQRYMPNVTAEIAEGAAVPLLTVRFHGRD